MCQLVLTGVPGVTASRSVPTGISLDEFANAVTRLPNYTINSRFFETRVIPSFFHGYISDMRVILFSGL